MDESENGNRGRKEKRTKGSVERTLASEHDILKVVMVGTGKMSEMTRVQLQVNVLVGSSAGWGCSAPTARRTEELNSLVQ